jgi:hypothetical protein
MPSSKTLLCLAAFFAGSVHAQALTAAERQHMVAQIWSDARYQFAYWDRVKADWDSALVASLAAAARPQSDVEFFRRLRRYVALLEHGQTLVVPAGRARDRYARPPLEVVALEGRPFIMDYAENDEMRVARPERLAEIVAVQGIPAERWITDSVLPETPGAGRTDRWHRAVSAMLAGPRGTALHLLLRLPDGATRGASVTRSVSLGARWPLQHAALEVDTLPDRSVLVRLNDFDDPDFVKDFDRAFPDFAGVRGLVLDLRANASRAAEPGYAVLARLVHRPFITGKRRFPVVGADSSGWREAAPDTVTPRTERPIYTGPVAALAGGGTADAGEDFLVALRNASRGPIIGEPTAGHSGHAASIALPRGWRFELCVARHAFPDGAEFVETGIPPELRVATLIEDVLKGHDAPLGRARDYVTGRTAAGAP